MSVLTKVADRKFENSNFNFFSKNLKFNVVNGNFQNISSPTVFQPALSKTSLQQSSQKLLVGTLKFRI